MNAYAYPENVVLHGIFETKTNDAGHLSSPVETFSLRQANYLVDIWQQLLDRGLSCMAEGRQFFPRIKNT
jgi:hypothetical protein